MRTLYALTKSCPDSFRDVLLKPALLHSTIPFSCRQRRQEHSKVTADDDAGLQARPQQEARQVSIRGSRCIFAAALRDSPIMRSLPPLHDRKCADVSVRKAKG